MKTLFDATNMNGLQLKNRLIRSGTWDGLIQEDGHISEDCYKIYEAVAAGGVGAIITALGDVKETDWGLPGNMRFCDDALIPDYQKLVAICHKYDCKIIPQINLHHYRNGSTCMEVKVDQLMEDELQDIIAQFKDAAIRMKKCGFDAIQIHCCYGWLLNRFMDPAMNHRTDEWGGTPENRIRLAVEILKAIKQAVPDMHVMAKMGMGVPGYTHEELNVPFGGLPEGAVIDDQCVADFVTMCKEMEKAGLDSIEIAGIWVLKGKDIEGAFVPYANAVREALKIPVISVGGHRDPRNMERVLNRDRIEYFSLCRPLICEPDLPNRWKSGDYSPARCISCCGCYHTYGTRCVFGDTVLK